jgi:hypothetical protein
MNSFDPFTSPHSYNRTFNGTQSLKYEEAQVSFHPAIWRSAFWLALIIITTLLGFGASLAFAQGEQRAVDIARMKGKTIAIGAVVCLQRGNADALLGHIKHGGLAEAAPYLRDPDTTCFFDDYRVVVGSVLAGADAPDGKTWNIVDVASVDDYLETGLRRSAIVGLVQPNLGQGIAV